MCLQTHIEKLEEKSVLVKYWKIKASKATLMSDK